MWHSSRQTLLQKLPREHSGKRALAACRLHRRASRQIIGTQVSDEIRAECSVRKQVPSELQLTAEQAQGPTSDSMEACAAVKAQVKNEAKASIVQIVQVT